MPAFSLSARGAAGGTCRDESETLLRAEIGFWREMLGNANGPLPPESVERMRFPLAGALVESRYDELSGPAKLLSIIGFFGVVGAWQALGMRSRTKGRPRRGAHDQTSLS